MGTAASRAAIHLDLDLHKALRREAVETSSGVQRGYNEMNRVVMVSVALACLLGFAASSMASESCEILFKGTVSKLSKQGKQQICDKLGFSFSRKKGFFVETCGNVSPEVKVVDLNGDGVMEVFVNYGNICTSGNTGRTIILFIKNSAGEYVENLGFPAMNYKIRPARNRGFPDLSFGGPGFCHGVWQWNGTKYVYKCSYEEEPGACERKGVQRICKQAN
jgi:hypothetical protein